MKYAVITVILISFCILYGQNYTFVESHALSGVSRGSSAWGDYDNDGDQDVVISGYYGDSSSPLLMLYRNDNTVFTYIEDVSNSLYDVGNYSALSWGDFDSDGDLDLMVAGNGLSVDDIYMDIAAVYVFHNGLVVNTIFLYLYDGVGNPAVAWSDLNNDGYLDLIITGNLNRSSTYISKVYRYDASSHSFIDINAGLPGVYKGSVSCADFNNDGFMDFLLAGQSSSGKISRIYRNNGNMTFTDIAAGLTGLYQTGPAWGDYDNDGDQDLLLTGYTGSNCVSRLYRNNGNSTFTSISAGLQVVDRGAVSWGDYDNDGDLDIIMTGQHFNTSRYTKLYSNNNGVFSVVATSLPQLTDSFVTWVDFDNDGDLDIHLSGYSGSAYISKLYSNSGGSNHWLKIRTHGVLSNADGIGARIVCHTTGNQYRQIASGSGWIVREAHFGVGAQTSVNQLSVFWPRSGITNTLDQVQTNQQITIPEISIPVPQISNISVSQRTDQTKMIDIYFSVSHNTPTTISLQASNDNGNSWSFPCLMISGDVGPGISPGNGKHIVWDVLQEHPDIIGNLYKIKIITDDGRFVVIPEGHPDQIEAIHPFAVKEAKNEQR